MPEINKTLVRRVRNYLLAEPLRYKQSILLDDNDRYAPCDTAGCIKGTTDLLLDHAIYRSWDATARDLGLTEKQGDVLFAGSPDSWWPEPFRSRWKETLNLPVRESRHAQVRICADLLNLILREGGQVLTRKGSKS